MTAEQAELRERLAAGCDLAAGSRILRERIHGVAGASATSASGRRLEPRRPTPPTQVAA